MCRTHTYSFHAFTQKYTQCTDKDNIHTCIYTYICDHILCIHETHTWGHVCVFLCVCARMCVCVCVCVCLCVCTLKTIFFWPCAIKEPCNAYPYTSCFWICTLSKWGEICIHHVFEYKYHVFNAYLYTSCFWICIYMLLICFPHS